MHEADGAADTTGGGKLRKVLKMFLHHFDCILICEEHVMFLESAFFYFVLRWDAPVISGFLYLSSSMPDITTVCSRCKESVIAMFVGPLTILQEIV